MPGSRSGAACVGNAPAISRRRRRRRRRRRFEEPKQTRRTGSGTASRADGCVRARACLCRSWEETCAAATCCHQRIGRFTTGLADEAEAETEAEAEAEAEPHWWSAARQALLFWKLVLDTPAWRLNRCRFSGTTDPSAALYRRRFRLAVAIPVYLE